MDESPTPSWRAVFDRQYSALVDEVSSRIDSDMQEAVGRAAAAERSAALRQIESARRATAEALNQTFRRMRQVAAETEVLSLLADGTAPWAGKMVVVSLENGQVRPVSVRNLRTGSELTSGDSTFVLETAGAIQSVAESRDPMVAMVSAGELSPLLAEAFADPADDEAGKAYLFPVLVRQNVVAVLIACGNVIPSPLEVLSEAAGMKMELLSQPAFRPSPSMAELVQIAQPPASPPSSFAVAAPAQRIVWEDLSPEDQKLHLQAQRVARVRVAEMRLYHAEELRKGVFAGGVYQALRNEIDAARRDFLQVYLSQSPTMVDYLHLEILRSLANDDDRLLGNDYPGPMV